MYTYINICKYIRNHYEIYDYVICTICLLLPKNYSDKFSALEIHKCQF